MGVIGGEMETLTWGWDERLIKDGEDPVLRTDSVFQMRDVLEWYVSNISAIQAPLFTANNVTVEQGEGWAMLRWERRDERRCERGGELSKQSKIQRVRWDLVGPCLTASSQHQPSTVKTTIRHHRHRENTLLQQEGQSSPQH